MSELRACGTKSTVTRRSRRIYTSKNDSKDPAPTERILAYAIGVTNLGPAAAGGAS